MHLNDEARKRLWHIAAAGRAILGWTAKKAADDYADSHLLRAAVEREFITIGEALRAALQVESNLSTAISGTARIVGFRNVLVHNYENINSDEVWAIVHDSLPLLLSECRSLLGELPA
jgi:uncharacterized protein with HEPN domain